MAEERVLCLRQALANCIIKLHRLDPPAHRWCVTSGDDNNGLWALLGFQSLDQFLDFLAAAGLWNKRTIIGQQETYVFAKKKFREMLSSERLAAEPYGRQRILCLTLGKTFGEDVRAFKDSHKCKQFWTNEHVLAWSNSTGTTSESSEQPTSPALPPRRPATPPRRRVSSFFTPRRSMPLVGPSLSATTRPVDPPVEGIRKVLFEDVEDAVEVYLSPNDDILIENVIRRAQPPGTALRKRLRQWVTTPFKLGNRKERREAVNYDTVPTYPMNIAVPHNQVFKTPRILMLKSKPKGSFPVGMEYHCIEEAEGPLKTLHLLVSRGFYPVVWRQEDGEVVLYPCPTKRKDIDKTALTMMEKELCEKKDLDARINSLTRSSRFSGTPFVRRLLGGMVAFHPKVSSLAWEQVAAIFYGSLLDKLGLGTDPDTLARISPTRETFENFITDFAVDSVMLIRDSLARATASYISYDKADTSKGGMGGLCKLISIFDDRLVSADFPDGKVITMTLDSDKAGDKSKDIASAIAHSLRGLNENVKLKGITSDSGGGGNTESGGAAIYKEGFLHESYLVGNCTLHNLNLEGSVAMKKVMKGKPTKDSNGNDQVSRDVEQMTFTAYYWEYLKGRLVVEEFWKEEVEHVEKQFELSLEDGLEDDENQEVYEDIIMMMGSSEKGRAFVPMIRGAETRWWSFGEAATTLYDTLVMRRDMAKHYDDVERATSGKRDNKIRKIAQTFLSLSAEPVLVNDLAFNKCFHRFYLAQHLKFFQAPDHLTRAPGCQPFSVFVRTFLMREDYLSMEGGGWKTIGKFKDVQVSLQKIPSEEERALQERKIAEFLCHAHEEHNKMFARWKDINILAFLGAFSEAATGEIFCRHILGLPPKNLTTRDFFESKNHDRRVDLSRFLQFVEACIPQNPATIKNVFHVAKNLSIITQIADGLDIWKDRELEPHLQDQNCRSIRMYILGEYGPFFTNQQGAERANKDQNLANSNMRQERNTSTRVVAMSRIKEMCETRVLGTKDQRPFRGKKRINDMLQKITDVHEQCLELEKSMPGTTYQDQRKEIKTQIQKKNFEKTKIEEERSKFKASLKQEVHIKSKIEAQQGYHIAPIMKGRVPLTKIFSTQGKPGENLRLLKEELVGRLNEGHAVDGVSLDNVKSLGIKKVKDAILAIEDAKAKEEGDQTYDRSFLEVRFSNVRDWAYDRVG